MLSEANPARVLVCGTGFGMMYLTALRQDPRLKLVGLMSRGSETSRQLAAELGVPLYTSTAELPSEIDLACVAVGGLGGHELRLDLMKRGVHILAEHPIYPRPLLESLDAAAAHGVLFHQHTHFEMLPAVDAFIEEARRLTRESPPLYGEILCATPTVFSGIDIMRLILGTLQPFAFAPPATWDGELATAQRAGSLPMLCMPLVLGGVPVSLLAHKGAFASEGYDIPHSHRITLGFASGMLTLHSLWGPVTFSRWLSEHVPADAPLSVQIDDGAPLTPGRYLKTRVAVVHHAVFRLAEQIRDGGPSPDGQDREHMLEVSRCWQQVFAKHLRIREPDLE